MYLFSSVGGGGRCGSSSGVGWKRSSSLTCFPKDVVPQWDSEGGGNPSSLGELKEGDTSQTGGRYQAVWVWDVRSKKSQIH